MQRIESTPFLLNTPYGLYNKKNEIMKNRYFKILEVIKDETLEDPYYGEIRTLTLKIEYTINALEKPLILVGAELSKNPESNNEYTLFYNAADGKTIQIPSLVVSTEPLNHVVGGRKNRKSTKKVRKNRSRSLRRK